ncbi:MAG: oligosaccharide flippase family protein [Clostridia bacterium]|nr:oligosaccharide flippase family protein [Clostridia bacterium]
MKINKEKKASILYLFSTLFNKGIAFLTVPIFTRLLSTSDYGLATTYTSWVDIFTVVLSLALYMSIRTAFVDFKEEKKEFLNTIITFTLIISFVFNTIVIILGQIFRLDIFLIVCAIIQGTAGALLIDYQQYLMMELKYVQRSIFLSLPNFLGAILSIIILLYIPMSQKYMGRIIPMLITHILFGIVIMCCVYKKQKPLINKKYLKYGLTLSLPLVLHGIALNVLSQSDRTMITVLASSSETGIYSLVYNFGMIATVITTALEGVWVPWFMSKIEKNSIEEINDKALDYIKLITCAMVGLILVGPEILKILASKEYWEGINIIPPIVLANYFVFMYSLHVNVEHYYKKTLVITVNTIIAAVVNVILNFLFIPKYGYVAAAYTTVIAYLVALILHAKCTYKLEKNIFPIKDIINPIVTIGIITIMYHIWMNNIIVRWGIFAIYMMTILIKEKDKIKMYLKS